jgi:hypothetical protein
MDNKTAYIYLHMCINRLVEYTVEIMAVFLSTECTLHISLPWFL